MGNGIAWSGLGYRACCREISCLIAIHRPLSFRSDCFLFTRNRVIRSVHDKPLVAYLGHVQDHATPLDVLARNLCYRSISPETKPEFRNVDVALPHYCQCRQKLSGFTSSSGQKMHTLDFREAFPFPRRRGSSISSSSSSFFSLPFRPTTYNPSFASLALSCRLLTTSSPLCRRRPSVVSLVKCLSPESTFFCYTTVVIVIYPYHQSPFTPNDSSP
nr:hypothetical protein CFP56_44308 [Quercus suber]